LTEPNSLIPFLPFAANSLRNVFKIPTLIIAAAYKSGRSVTALPIKIPPALALQTAILSGEEYFPKLNTQ
jgi:hypothetical protein